MEDFILFNGKNSYDDFELVIEEPIIVPAPNRDIATTPIEGRNGDLTEDLGTYSDIPIPIKFAICGDNNKDLARKIKLWLLGNKIDKSLILGDDIEYFYKTKNVKSSELSTKVLTIGHFTVTFTCEPFAYLKSGRRITTIIQQPSILYNPGYKSLPIIKVYGTGDISLNIGSQEIILTDIDGYITIDSVMQNAYKDTENQNSKMDGECPVFIEGKNNITWTGNITKIEVIPNWCSL